MSREAIEVLNSHLALRSEGDLEQDLAQNFDEGVILLTMDGEFSGHDGVRKSNALLLERTKNANYEYLHRSVQDDVAFLVWSAVKDGTVLSKGADSFVIKNGKIIAQTIYYDSQT